MWPFTGRTPSFRAILAIIALLLTALYLLGLVVDWPAWIRGSNWVWVRRVPSPGWRFLLMPAALAAGLALAGVSLRGGGWRRRQTALFLAGLVALAPLVQMAVAAQHRSQPLSVVVMSAAGFWHEGARIQEPLAFAREHAARMPHYADVHVRTQPPGWPLAHWALGRAFARAPGAADFIGRWIHRYDCTAPELLGLDPAQLAAGSLRVAILLLSGLGALPLYAIGRRFYPPTTARLAAAGYTFLPALLVFSGRFDVVYALLGLVAVWLALRAVLDGRRAAGVALAFVVAVSSFLSFTALVVAALAFVVAAFCAWAEWGFDDARLRRVVWLALGTAVALAVFWGGLRLAGIDGVAMWRTGQAIHREYRLNYPAWFLFNLYDLAVFMGIVPFVGALGAVWLGRGGQRAASWRGLALGWAAAVLLLNLSATVRAETGRLWLFLMPLGLLMGLATFAGSGRGPIRRRGPVLVLFAAFLVQALVMGYLLGGRAAEPGTPPPAFRVPAARPLDYRLGDAVSLRGYAIAPESGGSRLTLYWQAIDFPRAEYSAFVHIVREGEIVAQSDGPPAGVPMWCWVPGEVVADERQIVLPEGAEIEVGVGLYDPISGVRLLVAPPVPDDRIPLPVAP